MVKSSPNPMTPDERAQMKQWLDNWARVSPILEAERWARLSALTDAETWAESQDLLAAWEPDLPGDAGEGLLLHQDLFARWPRRR